MLTALRLSHFRCYSTLCWEIPAEGAILLGANAQGKTSLIEAICMALTLHSPRVARMDKLAAHGQTHFGISLDTEEHRRRLLWEKGKKTSLQINGVEQRDYCDFLADSHPVTWLGNRDISLVNGGAEERRRYLDFLGSQWHPVYREALQNYRKALRSRNALLRHPRRNTGLLRNYAEILATHGEIIIRLRQQLLERLTPHINHTHHSIAHGEETVQLAYLPSTTLPLQQALDAALAADEHAGCTTVGPHRDDFLLHIAGRRADTYASEGQQRTLATAMQMAQSGLLHEETGKAPILLIDDIFGELDSQRRRSLLSVLPAESQVFITTTGLDWLGDMVAPLPLIRVENAKLHRL